MKQEIEAVQLGHKVSADKVEGIITGRMAEPNYKLLMGLAGWFGGGCGRGLALHIMGGRKSSFVAFCLALVLAVAAILVLYELVTTPPSWTSQGVC